MTPSSGHAILDALLNQHLGIGLTRCAERSVKSRVLMHNGDPLPFGTEVCENLAPGAEGLAGVFGVRVSVAPHFCKQFLGRHAPDVVAYIKASAQFAFGHALLGERHGHRPRTSDSR